MLLDEGKHRVIDLSNGAKIKTIDRSSNIKRKNKNVRFVDKGRKQSDMIYLK